MQIHHIDRIDSSKGNAKLNLIVLCPDCHRRAHLASSYFERRLTKNQLKMYKKKWTNLCKTPFHIASDKWVLVYTFLNKPRIQMLFNQVASDSEVSKVAYLKMYENELIVATIPFEKMMQTIINKIDFVSLETLDHVQTCNGLKELEGLPVYIRKDFYGHGLKSPVYYERYGVKEIPFLFKRQKFGTNTLLIKIPFDPRNIISTTGYTEMKGHNRLSCYGIVKRLMENRHDITMEIMPLAIGLQHPIPPYIAYFRLF